MSVQVKLNWHGPQAVAFLHRKAEKAVWQAAEELLTRSNQRVPLDTGLLQSTGEASIDDLTGCVSYNTPYAVKLHEHPEFDFQGGREGKWLEHALNENKTELLQYIADQLKI